MKEEVLSEFEKDLVVLALQTLKSHRLNLIREKRVSDLLDKINPFTRKEKIELVIRSSSK